MKFYKNSNNAEIAPCIISKAYFALDIKNIKPKNKKKCSREYWEEVVEVVAVFFDIGDQKIIEKAKGMYLKLVMDV